jgi:hypothetical protein
VPDLPIAARSRKLFISLTWLLEAHAPDAVALEESLLNPTRRASVRGDSGF